MPSATERVTEAAEALHEAMCPCGWGGQGCRRHDWPNLCEWAEAAIEAAAVPSPAVDRPAPKVSVQTLGLAIYQGGHAQHCHQNTIARNLLSRYDIRERGTQPAEPDGAAMIAAERHRAVASKGYDAAHDDRHDRGELAAAAMCYAADPNHIGVTDDLWPWGTQDWKPTPEDRIRELVKAGQLLAAEIDRLLRLQRSRAGAS